jgi:hypothetical protein
VLSGAFQNKISNGWFCFFIIIVVVINVLEVSFCRS